MTEQSPLPNALVIGAQKSATRWLRTNLAEHPAVFFAAREIEFFSHERRYVELGLEWYRRQFEGWAGEPVVAEGTPGYLMWRHGPEAVAQRIDESLPDVRLLAVLRNPIDRAQSALLHHTRYERIAPGTRLVDFARTTPAEEDWMGIIAGGWYGRSLRPYVATFDARLRVLLYDDVVSRPETVYRSAIEHLGLTAEHEPSSLREIVFGHDGPTPAPLTVEERLQLWPYFRDDVRDLEELIGRDLSQWDPTATADPNVM